jgi:hypothetical protein
LFAAGEPGVWYDPSDVANLAWRRNLLLQTEAFDVTWTNASGSLGVTANTIAAPDGTMTADKLVPAAATAYFAKRQSTFTSAASTSYAFSVYAKESDTGVRLEMVSYNSGVTAQAIFNLATGAVVATGVGTTTSVGAADANGWRRYEIRWTATLSAATITDVKLTESGSLGANMTGDGSKGIFVWGAQIELGSTATDYQRITTVDAGTIARFPNATLYQDTIGTIPVTTPGQAVALMLDKSRGLALGPELVVNGTFDTDVSGWTLVGGGTIAAVGGRLRVTSNGTLTRARAEFPTVVGKTYNLVFDAYRGTAVNYLFYAGPTTGTNTYVNKTSPDGTTNLKFVATSTSLWIDFFCGTSTAGLYSELDNISVRELPGAHATQATAASRPTYGVVPQGGRRNLLTFSEQFDNAAWGTNAGAISANSSTAPDGITTADTFTPTATLAAHFVVNGVANPSSFATSGVTFSIYVKSNGYTSFGIREQTVTGAQAAFSLTGSGSTFAVVNGTATGTVATITALSDGWYRCTMAVAASVTYQGFRLYALNPAYTSGNMNSESWTANGTSGIFIWGAQLEVTT